ncbi:hypothetical protein T440DRAFT_494273 [Plenodomus tracheiphilus IPT5]|uniref:Uncharacterized protein n=1 Tax=Plenodomus tracheiphilus IPT5 TaxID=1408161 RepID=A0A6A7ALL6_9PLEO|nr:hypothetical protein T440DRAFT_494273 [Plenodomus tracheiphilus IPT5]
MPLHILLPPYLKLNKQVVENNTYKAIINKILQSRLNDISNAVGKRLSCPSIKLEIMRNISSCITTKPGEIFAIENKANKVAKLLEKGIHLVLANISFLVLEFVNFIVLPFKYKH